MLTYCPIHLLPAEIRHPEKAQRWALAVIRRNAIPDPDEIESDESLADDSAWMARYLLKLARLRDHAA